MSDRTTYDFVVIGGGSAGYAAAAAAVGLGLKTAVIEGGDEVGGLCILRGCMPSKTLLESGHRAAAIQRAAEFGLQAEYRGADGPAIVARKRRLVAEFSAYRREQLEAGAFTFIRGLARFTGPHTLEVRLREGGALSVEARTFLVATGSEISWLPIPGIAEAGCLTSDDALESDRIPRSVIILGAGPTGVEFASYYAGVGAEVTIVQRSPHLLKNVDPDLSDALSAALERRGIRIFTGTTLQRVEKSGGVKRVAFRQGEQDHTVEAEEIVYALGRQPAAGALHLAEAGVEIAPRGFIRVNASQQTSAPHIFAAGDVCGPYEVVHIAIQQGELAARNAAKVVRQAPEGLEEIDYSLKLFAVFSHPEVATVGLTVREARDRGLDFADASYPFADHGKAMVHGETDGFVKLLAAGPDRRIIGAGVVGPAASELIHEIVVAMHFGATAAQLAAIPHYHPTLSEIWTYPAESLAKL